MSPLTADPSPGSGAVLDAAETGADEDNQDGGDEEEVPMETGDDWVVPASRTRQVGESVTIESDGDGDGEDEDAEGSVEGDPEPAERAMTPPPRGQARGRGRAVAISSPAAGGRRAGLRSRTARTG